MKLKRKLVITILVIIMILCTSSVFAVDKEEIKVEENKIDVLLDGRRILDKVFVINKVNYVPLNEFCKLLDIDVFQNKNYNIIELSNNKALSQDEPILQISKYSGTAKLTYDNGTIYKGGYKNGLFNGQGEIIYADGTSYKGNFIQGVIEGQGVFKAINGDVYDGSFKDNKFNGYGEYTFSNDDVIKGEFVNNEIVSNYIYYRVKAENEVKHVRNKYFDKPIEIINNYCLNFDKTKFNGSVDVIFEDGTHYDGHVSNDYFNGIGTLTYKDSSTYKGNFVYNKKTGKGTFTYANGSCYRGYFLNDLYDGEGEFTYVNGDKFKGVFVENKKEGYGKYTEANGNYFEGYWKNNVKHTIDHYVEKKYRGFGKYYIKGDNTSNGKSKTIMQSWTKGELTREIKL